MSAPEVQRGAMIVLTREASESVLGRDPQDGLLAGLVLDLLDPDFEGDRVWGALVNGEFLQILDREIQEVVLADAADSR